MQRSKQCTAQLHRYTYTSLNTRKLLHPRMAFPPWLLCTGTVLNSGVVSVAAALISVPRLHATSLGTRTGLLLFFFQDKAPSVQDRGQDKEFRDCPGRSGTLGNYGFPITYRKMNYFGGREIRAKQKSSMRFYVATCILHVHCAPWDSTRNIKAIGQWWRLHLVT